MKATHTCSIPGCDRLVKAHGWCSMHYQRWQRWGDPTVTLTHRGLQPTERFWVYVNKTDTCWLWTGTINTNGYGQLYRGLDETHVYAHRFAYELLVGPIPPGLTIDHVRARGCVHRHCVNPDHLEPVTMRENTLRGDTLPARNAAKTHCPRGHVYDSVNTYLLNAKSGRRRTCRACALDKSRLRREKGRG